MDDALQNLTRLIELLSLGQGIDLEKRIARGNNPPYFREGQSMAADALLPLGQHPLDPSPDVDPVRFFLEAGKTHLLCVEECRVGYQRRMDGDQAANGHLGRMQRAGEDARLHLGRLIELLAGYVIDPARRGQAMEELRLLKRCTEADWLACADLDSLSKMLRPLDYGSAIRFSERKWRLFALACVRRVCHTFQDQRTLGLVKAVEDLADGLLTEEELKRLWREAREPANPDTDLPEGCPPDQKAARCAFQSLAAIPFGLFEAACASGSARWARAAAGQSASEEAAQVALLRDIFGSPHRPVPRPAPGVLAWNGGLVVRLAQAIYDERAFDRLPILGDALEEAGCNDPAVLEHCRGPGPHERGCHVLDLVLGRS